MKKSLTLTLLALMALLAPRQAMAQDDADIVGYTRINLTVKTAVSGSGKVYPAAKAATVKAWREEWNFTGPVAVGSYMGSNMFTFFIYQKPEDGYMFAGWYMDNGDGVFNIENDSYLGDDEELYYMDLLDEDATVYATEALAKNGTVPTKSNGLIWAYFTKGATVGMSHYQGDEFSHFANCGSVFINKPINEPGDVITVEALPNDGFHFAYWQDKDELGNVVSRQNPYTFTVKGGEHLFAYFEADDAPKVTLPAEGGYAVIKTDKAWFLSDECVKNGAHVYVMTADDLRRDAQGRAYLDTNVTEDGELVAQVDVAQINGEPTIVYGKGEVRFSIYLKNINFTRSYNNLVQWSGDKGVSLKGDVIYVYVFAPELGAFIQYGTTDDYNPNATASVKVPANLAYFSMSAWDLADTNTGEIPTVIGFSPEAYDKGMAGASQYLDQLAGIEGVTRSSATLKGHKVYTLSGVEVKATPKTGVFIVNGKKVVLK